MTYYHGLAIGLALGALWATLGCWRWWYRPLKIAREEIDSADWIIEDLGHDLKSSEMAVRVYKKCYETEKEKRAKQGSTPTHQLKLFENQN